VKESLHALSGAYVVDALDNEEREAFEQHLPRCLDCQAEVASLREATALMADDAAVTPPDSLRSSVLAGISTIRPLPPEVGQQRTEEPAPPSNVVPMRRRRFRVASLVAAAAVAASVAVGVTWHPWDDQNTSSVSAADQVLAAADAQKVSLDFKDGSSASVYRSKSKGKAVILTDGMAAPPAGKVYELWLQDSTGTMVPAGLMPRSPNAKVLLKGDAAKATGVGITVEPEGGSKTPTSEPIALFELGQDDA
jgi:anti-sigma-K factor RskA